jgi:hypothetical protein
VRKITPGAKAAPPSSMPRHASSGVRNSIRRFSLAVDAFLSGAFDACLTFVFALGCSLGFRCGSGLRLTMI